MSKKNEIFVAYLRLGVYSVQVDGLVVFTGSEERCKIYAQSLASGGDRDRQDQFLGRAVQVMR